MLIHPWDAATSDAEWQAWVAAQSVGTLVVPTADLPVVVPTHFVWTGEHVLLEGEELLDLLRTQLGRFEPGSGVADPSAHLRQLPGIRGVRLTVESVQAKFKYGGNVDDAHRTRLAQHLKGQGSLGALRQLTRRTPLEEA